MPQSLSLSLFPGASCCSSFTKMVLCFFPQISMHSSKMQSESPMPSPGVDYYEECVVTEEDAAGLSVSKPTAATGAGGAAAAAGSRVSAVPRVNKDKGRVTKKSKHSSK